MGRKTPRKPSLILFLPNKYAVLMYSIAIYHHGILILLFLFFQIYDLFLLIGLTADPALKTIFWGIFLTYK